MTSKDLNLTLEQRPGGFAPGKRSSPQDRLPQDKLTRLGPGAAANSSPAEKPARATASPGISLPGVALVLVLGNALVLAAAAYWLYLQPAAGMPAAGKPAAGTPAAGMPPDMEPALARALELLDAQAGALDVRVEQLQQALGAHQALTTSALLDLQEQLAALRPATGSPAAGSPAAGSPAAKSPPVVDAWVINAGTFASVGPAERRMRQLSSLGYETRLGTVLSAGEQQHRVQVTGFVDRAAAEETARSIVRETDLNGLWVWKES